MMDDREISLIAAFRVHEVSSRLNILARVTHSDELRDLLMDLSRNLVDQERRLATISAELERRRSPLPQQRLRRWAYGCSADRRSSLYRCRGRR